MVFCVEQDRISLSGNRHHTIAFLKLKHWLGSRKDSHVIIEISYYTHSPELSRPNSQFMAKSQCSETKSLCDEITGNTRNVVL